VREIVNVMLLRATSAAPAQALPDSGASARPGNRTCGIDPVPARRSRSTREGVRVRTAARARLGTVLRRSRRWHKGDVAVFVALGGNFGASATPDLPSQTPKRYSVQADGAGEPQAEREPVVQGKQARILPCLGRTEKDLQAPASRRSPWKDAMCRWWHISLG